MTLILSQKGFTYVNLMIYYFAAFANVSALVFLNSSLPYLLKNFLKIPKDEQSIISLSYRIKILNSFINFLGDMIGNILLCNELTLIASVYCWGLLSDVIGYSTLLFIQSLVVLLTLFRASIDLLYWLCAYGHIHICPPFR